MNAALIAKVRKYIPDVVVHNTKYSSPALRTFHMAYVERAGMNTDSYHSIVVEGEGERITLLKAWKP